ncbi:MAG: class I adenylate-forming enzyme family protein [Actinomycetota bacterium]
MNVARLLDDHVEEHGDHEEVFFEGRWYTTGETLSDSRRLGAGLQELGVGAGDRVVVLLPNCPEVGISYWGSWRIGAAVTPVIFMLPPPEIHRIIEDSEAKVAITSPDFLANLQNAAHGVDTLERIVCIGKDPQPDTLSWDDLLGSGEAEMESRDENDLAALLYTGGTTGASKGVMLSHHNLGWTARAAAAASELEPDGVGLLSLPLSHGFGLHVSIVGTLVPGRGVLLRWFDPNLMLDMIEEHRVERMAVVPTMLQLLLMMPLEERDLSSLRSITSGAAGLPGEVQRAWEERVPNCPILQGYGLTETSPTVAVQPPTSAENGTRKIGSVGRVVDGVEVRIEGDEGAILGPNEIGEITVKGPNVMLGYWRNEAATAEAIKDGWFHTGDMGKLDEDGNLFIVERKKDLVIRGGFNVYPADVEGVLLQHPGVNEAAIVGRPSDRWGEEPVAFVVLASPDVKAEEIMSYCEGELAKYKIPAEIRPVPMIPKTPVGKIDKKALRAEL